MATIPPPATGSPVSTLATDARPVKTKEKQKKFESLDISRVSFLVVEDNWFMRSLLNRILNSFKCRFVETASNGLEAWAGLKSGAFHPDVILTDWEMPEMNGLDLIREIRASEEPALHYLPVIIITGYTELTHIKKAINTGANEYLAKPISPTALYDRIVSIILRPRRFVRVPGYFGPDRHRRKADLEGKEDRREREPAEGQGGN